MKVSRALSIAAAVDVLGVGVLGMLFPEPLSEAFGVPASEPEALAFVRAASVRDIAIGAIVLAASLDEESCVLPVALGAGIGISAADFAATRRPIHAAGAALFAVTFGLLLAGL